METPMELSAANDNGAQGFLPPVIKLGCQASCWHDVASPFSQSD